MTTVIKVGSGGRGFLVDYGYRRVVVTAAHCLPHLPPAHPGRYLEEETYPKLLGPLGDEPTIWATCWFADPVADIAVLGEPDDQALGAEYEAYGSFVESASVFKIGSPERLGFDKASPVSLLSLDGKWVTCDAVTADGHWLIIKDDALIEGGMSGSPILSPDGVALAVFSTGLQNPLLWDCLPARFFRS